MDARPWRGDGVAGGKYPSLLEDFLAAATSMARKRHLHQPQGVYYGFCLAPSIHQQIRSIRLIRGRKREEFIGKDEQAINHLHFHTFCIKMAVARQKTSKLAFLHSPCTLFPQNLYTIQINALSLHHQNPQAS